MSKANTTAKRKRRRERRMEETLRRIEALLDEALSGPVFVVIMDRAEAKR